MSREIKFRVWHKNNNCMCENVKIDLLNRDYLDFLQYTGLKDSKGKEIYEGDIVNHTYYSVFRKNKEITGIVSFIQGSWRIVNGERTLMLHDEECKNTVIGNKYENSDLLKSRGIKPRKISNGRFK